MTSSFRIVPAAGPSEWKAFGDVTRSYLGHTGLDLSFQNIEKELSGLPGEFAPERRGGILLAVDDASGAILGGVAVRHAPWCDAGPDGAESSHVCEMKRLHVLDTAMGRGVGSALVRACEEEGARLGYSLIVLDTIVRLEGAVRLYKRAGYTERTRYNNNPYLDVVYLEKPLK